MLPEANGPSELRQVRRLLERDRVWSAYALADTEPPYAGRTTWLRGERSVVMVYRGLTPPLLFAHGDPDDVDALFHGLAAGAVQYGLLATHRALLGTRLRPARETHMWRMVLRREDFPAGRATAAERLGPEDLGAIHDLFGEYPDQPDSFDPTQLAAGDFFGIRSGPRLISVAGTHVIGRETGVAAVGNVFTHPQHRGRGHAARVSAAVVEALLERRIETIVLNVAMANQAALGLYRALGFMPFCGYYEGVGDLFGSRPEGTKAA